MREASWGEQINVDGELFSYGVLGSPLSSFDRLRMTFPLIKGNLPRAFVENHEREKFVRELLLNTYEKDTFITH